MKDLEEFYKNYYILLKKATEKTKQIIESIVPFDKDQEKLIKKIKNARQELVELFNHPKIINYCRRCHQSGKGCCKQTSEDVNLKQQDVIYILANNLDFKLPEPDIKFLVSILDKRPACIFLSKKGCLLQENRPIICLDYYCSDGLSFVLNSLHLKEKLLENSQVINWGSLELVQTIIARHKNTKYLPKN